MRAPYYDDYCTIRVLDISKLKTQKTVIVNSKVEIALVRPGIVTDDGTDLSLRKDEDRIKLLNVYLNHKVKGQNN